jgi:hypothetical protein
MSLMMSLEWIPRGGEREAELALAVDEGTRADRSKDSAMAGSHVILLFLEIATFRRCQFVNEQVCKHGERTGREPSSLVAAPMMRGHSRERAAKTDAVK